MEKIQQRVQASVGRLQRLVFEKYGRRLEVVNRLEVDLDDGDLLVPMDWHGDNYASAVVRGGEDLSIDERAQIEDLVRLLIEPLIVSEMIRSDVKTSEVVSNVIPLFPEISIDLRQTEAALALAIGLETKNETLAFQTAVDIHEYVGSWALLSWNDINSRITNLNDLLDLGRSTLFIPDILNLTQEQRSLLTEFISSSLRRDTVVIVASPRPFTDLESEGLIEPDLSQALQKNLMRLENLPANRKQRVECIEMLLSDNLDMAFH